MILELLTSRFSSVNLSGDRAVIVGNGNVALDVARILVADPDDLERNTDIADHALRALRMSTIREVVVLGRRPPHQAAYSSPEFIALGHIPGVRVVVDASDIDTEAGESPREVSKRRIAQDYATRAGSATSGKQIVFRYRVAPVDAVGSSRVTGRIRAETDGGHRTETIECSMALSAIEHRGDALPGLPFDSSRDVVPNAAGRVIHEEAGPIPGVYVSGWFKRGSRGAIGTNRGDAVATVDGLIADLTAGRLASPPHSVSQFDQVLRSRRPELIDFAGWCAIDQEERVRGDAAGRPRVTFTAIQRMVAAARP